MLECFGIRQVTLECTKLPLPSIFKGKPPANKTHTRLFAPATLTLTQFIYMQTWSAYSEDRSAKYNGGTRNIY